MQSWSVSRNSAEKGLEGIVGRSMLVYAAATVCAGVLAAGALKSVGKSQQTATADERRKEIDVFNAKFLEAHLKMDHAAILGMWAEDGVSLLPDTTPMVGKAAITTFLGRVTEQLKDLQMEKWSWTFRASR